MVYYNDDSSVGAILIIHVDDIMIRGQQRLEPALPLDEIDGDLLAPRRRAEPKSPKAS